MHICVEAFINYVPTAVLPCGFCDNRATKAIITPVAGGCRILRLHCLCYLGYAPTVKLELGELVRA